VLSSLPLLLLAAWPLGPFQSELAPLPETRLVFGGDVMLSRHVGKAARYKKDPAWPLRGLAEYLSSASIAFVNLESPFRAGGKPVESGMVFKAEPEIVETLVHAGIDVVSTANNHARDQGEEGLLYTLKLLGEKGIAAAGTGESSEAAHRGAVLQRDGVSFGFLAYTYDQLNGIHAGADQRVAMLDVQQMQRDVRELKRRAIVVVSMHAGHEYQGRPNAQQVEFARKAIDAGAAVVVGHHPHVAQPVEAYRDGIILYSLGNLVFDQFHRRDTQEGLLAEVVFRGRRLERAIVYPVRLVNAAPQFAAGEPIVAYPPPGHSGSLRPLRVAD